MPRIIWTPTAMRHLGGIERYIAQDSRKRARKLVIEIRESVKSLVRSPFSGSQVPEFDRHDLREIFHGNYRIIYRADSRTLHVLAVKHGAQLLDTDEFSLERD